MPRKKGWKEGETEHGIVTVTISSWSAFLDYVENLHERAQRNSQFIWRGQRCSTWSLRTSFDRTQQINLHKQRQKGRSKQSLKSDCRIEEHFLEPHLNAFKYSARGHRGSNPPAMTSDNDWWALGQHHGLNTPLLDWTFSPFVACFFAFANSGPYQTDNRAIYAICEGDVRTTAEQINDEWEGLGRAPIMEFIRPLTDENPRLVSQGGLFTRGPVGMDLEAWIRAHYSRDYHFYVLIRILIPDKERENVLRSLNRMNINHLSLFPDLSGSAHYSNRVLDDPGYGAKISSTRDID